MYDLNQPLPDPGGAFGEPVPRSSVAQSSINNKRKTQAILARKSPTSIAKGTRADQPKDPAINRSIEPTGSRPAPSREDLAGKRLNLAVLFLKNNEPAKARTKLQEIIDLYPDTKIAESARAKLKELKPTP